MSLEIRAVIHFRSLKHTANQAILSELEEEDGGGVIALRVVQKWTVAFDAGRRSSMICQCRVGPVALQMSTPLVA
jgi:hypothetical protein